MTATLTQDGRIPSHSKDNSTASETLSGGHRNNQQISAKQKHKALSRTLDSSASSRLRDKEGYYHRLLLIKRDRNEFIAADLVWKRCFLMPRALGS